MVLMTNVCETCGDGRFTVTHHEAAHRCPVCELREELKDAESDAAEVGDLRLEVRDKGDEVDELERQVSRLEDERDELKDEVEGLEKRIHELENPS